MAVLDAAFTVLTEHRRARDSYEHFLYYYLLEMGRNPSKMTVQEMLAEMRGGYLPKWNTLERARRLVQERNPSVRGDTYEERQTMATQWRDLIED